MTVKDSALIPELQRRAAHDLEAGQHQHAGMSLHKETGAAESSAVVARRSAAAAQEQLFEDRR